MVIFKYQWTDRKSQLSHTVITPTVKACTVCRGSTATSLDANTRVAVALRCEGREDISCGKLLQYSWLPSSLILSPSFLRLLSQTVKDECSLDGEWVGDQRPLAKLAKDCASRAWSIPASSCPPTPDPVLLRLACSLCCLCCLPFTLYPHALSDSGVKPDFHTTFLLSFFLF